MILFGDVNRDFSEVGWQFPLRTKLNTSVFPFLLLISPARVSDTHWDLSSVTGKWSREENEWDFPSSTLDKKSPFVIERRRKKVPLFCLAALSFLIQMATGIGAKENIALSPAGGLSFNYIWGQNLLHVTPDIMCVVMVIFSRYTAGNFSFTSLKWRKMDCLDIFQTEMAHNHIGETKQKSLCSSVTDWE